MLIEITYAPLLLAGSILIAIMAAYAGLTVANNGRHILSRRWTIESAFASGILGMGIWSMHFVGMLAIKFGVVVSYDLFYTIASALVAILTMQLAVLFVIHGNKSTLHLTFAGAVSGIGISAMHYLGMEALSKNCLAVHSVAGVTISVLTSMTISVIAMQLAYHPYFRERIKLAGISRYLLMVCAAIAFGVSISATHYISIAATTFVLVEDVAKSTSSYFMDIDHLATYVTVAAFVLIWCSILVSSPKKMKGDRYSNENIEATFGLDQKAIPTEPNETPVAQQLLQIPLEKSGKIIFLSPHDIHSIQALGHYTMVFDGVSEAMCTWPISKLETELESYGFLRVHRSYLINSEHIKSLKKENERGICTVGFETEKQIPVSRTYMPALKQFLLMPSA